MMTTFSVQTKSHEELVDITPQIHKALQDSGISHGLCVIYTPHTTAAITINENADPDVQRDLIKGMAHLNMERVNFAHGEGNSPAHVKSTLTGCSETVIVDGGRLVLGTWQGIYFCEFDGPRSRKVHVKLLAG